MAKLLHVIRSANPEGGGPIEGVLQRGRVLREMGHTVEIVSLDSPETSISTDLPIHKVGPGRGSYGYTSTLDAWLNNHLSNYDHIIVNGIWQYHSLAVWKAAKTLGMPYHVFTHGMLDPWFKKTYPIKHLKKALYWPWAEYKVLRDAKAVLFTSEEEKLLARESFRFYQANELVVSYGTAAPLGNPDDQKELFLSTFPALRNRSFLLFLSRIHPKKGCDLLIKAFAEAYKDDRSTMLCMAGPDQVEWKDELTALAERLGISERVIWTGMLAGDLKWGAYSAAEAFVLPSHQENFGIVVAEAMACSKPALISNKVNIWREIEADQAGLIADDTLEGVFSLLQRWKSMPISDRQNMGANARVCFNRNFEVRRAAESILEVLGKGRH